MRRTQQLGIQTPRLTSLPQRLWYHWQLPAWYLLLLKHFTNLTRTQACISLSLSVFLTHLLAACVDIHFSLPNTHNAWLASMHTSTHMNLITPTDSSFTQYKCARGEQRKLEGRFCCLSYQCLSVSSDLHMIYESLDCLKTPYLQTSCARLMIAKVYSEYFMCALAGKTHTMSINMNWGVFVLM